MKRRRLLQRTRRKFSSTSYYQAPSRDRGETPPVRSRSKGQKAAAKGLSSLLRRRIVIKLAAGLFIAGVLVMVGLFGLTGNVRVSLAGGAHPELVERISSLADDKLSSGLNRFKPFVDEDALALELTEEVGSLVGTEVVIPAFSRYVTITGQIRSPQAYMRLSSDVMVYYDQTGAAYQDSDASASDLPRITDNSAADAAQLDAVNDLDIPAATVSFIQDINSILLDKSLANDPISVVIDDEPRTVVWQPGGADYHVKLLSSRDPLDQILEYETMLDYFERRSASPSRYIDLRVADTAYYR